MAGTAGRQEAELGSLTYHLQTGLPPGSGTPAPALAQQRLQKKIAASRHGSMGPPGWPPLCPYLSPSGRQAYWDGAGQQAWLLPGAANERRGGERLRGGLLPFPGIRLLEQFGDRQTAGALPSSLVAKPCPCQNNLCLPALPPRQEGNTPPRTGGTDKQAGGCGPPCLAALPGRGAKFVLALTPAACQTSPRDMPVAGVVWRRRVRRSLPSQTEVGGLLLTAPPMPRPTCQTASLRTYALTSLLWAERGTAGRLPKHYCWEEGGGLGYEEGWAGGQPAMPNTYALPFPDWATFPSQAGGAGLGQAGLGRRKAEKTPLPAIYLTEYMPTSDMQTGRTSQRLPVLLPADILSQALPGQGSCASWAGLSAEAMDWTPKWKGGTALLCDVEDYQGDTWGGRMNTYWKGQHPTGRLELGQGWSLLVSYLPDCWGRKAEAGVGRLLVPAGLPCWRRGMPGQTGGGGGTDCRGLGRLPSQLL